MTAKYFSENEETPRRNFLKGTFWLGAGIGLGFGTLACSDASKTSDVVNPSDFPEKKIEMKSEPVGSGVAFASDASRDDPDDDKGLKPYLGGKALIDDDGWVLPNGVDKNYNQKNIEDTILMRRETYNNKDVDRFLDVSWRSFNGRKEKIFKRIKKNFDRDHRKTDRYKIKDIVYNGDRAKVYLFEDNINNLNVLDLEKIDGNWYFV